MSKKREKVVRDTLRVLTHDATGVSTSGVEVAKEGRVPLLGVIRLSSFGGIVALSVDDVGDGGLNGELGVSVGVGGAQRALLGDGNHVGEAGSITVDGGRAGEDNVGDIVADHGAKETESAVDVDHVVVQWSFTGLANGLKQMAMRE